MTAHDAAVGAMAGVLCDAMGPLHTRPCAGHGREANTALAAFAASPEVRAALVDVAHDVTTTGVDSLGSPMSRTEAHRLRPCCVDAVLAALTPGGAMTDDGGG